MPKCDFNEVGNQVRNKLMIKLKSAISHFIKFAFWLYGITFKMCMYYIASVISVLLA